MDLKEYLDQLEDKYEGEWAENRDEIIEALTEAHKQAAEADEESFNNFTMQTASRYGGVYIPHLFWSHLNRFFDNPDNRIYIQSLIRHFADSDFEDEELHKMKPLLITYFSNEKPFELDKLWAVVIEKTHPLVKEYFEKLMAFVEKNRASTNLYIEKFKLLRTLHPDFETFALPVTELKERY